MAINGNEKLWKTMTMRLKLKNFSYKIKEYHTI